MKIAMFTNTYLPHVGGVARSVETLEDACRRHGHEVKVIAPEFHGERPRADVLRVPAIRNFNGSDFSVQIPVPNLIRDFIRNFQPDIIHSHHPFLLGDAALRESWKTSAPIIFTHHTLYERYTHYITSDSPALKRMAIQLSTEYGNLCDHVIAPSESIASLLRKRGVTPPIHSIPTGIDLAFFSSGNGPRFRAKLGIPPRAKLIGHVGRLAPEKKLPFLTESVSLCLRKIPSSFFLIVGEGDAWPDSLQIFESRGLSNRIFPVGKLSGQSLADAYAAMDCFAFSSQSETQGIVLAEAMAAGKPVVALDGPGVREIVRHGTNGFLLPAKSTPEDFAKALFRLLSSPALSRQFSVNALISAKNYDADRCARRILRCYKNALASPRTKPLPTTSWERLITNINVEWELLLEKFSAASAAIHSTPATEVRLD